MSPILPTPKNVDRVIRPCEHVANVDPRPPETCRWKNINIGFTKAYAIEFFSVAMSYATLL